MMRAYVCRQYGPPEVLDLVDIAKPIPTEYEVLVRVRATTVSSADCRIRSFDLPSGFGLMGRVALGIRRPRQAILGTELSGVIEKVGAKVTTFKAGDDVVAFPGSRMGCYAEYRCIHAHGPIALKPTNLGFEQAAALGFGGSTMLDFFRRGGLRPGERVLVNGASGAVGTAAVQIAKHLGAHVTGVCSTVNCGLVESLGADDVIDYRRSDFSKAGRVWDLIVDAAGTAPFARSRHALTSSGRLLVVLAGLAEMLRAPLVGITGSRKVIAGPAAERPEYVRQLASIASAGGLNPVIDRRYSFEDMHEAHRYVDTGRKRGNVVVCF